VGVQLWPATHPTHAPSEQTRFEPQVVPFVAGPVSVQTGNPVLQVSAAVWQGFAETQAAPGWQELHVPPPHTASRPHDAPSVTGTPVSRHTGPAEQSSTPT
jgi:hypothetical protein